MRFTVPRRRLPAENIVPMINVVFLLLIFFLMSARVTPPDPFAVAAPASSATDNSAASQHILFIDADARLAFGPLRGEAVWAGLAKSGGSPLILRADANLPASRLAGILRRLAAIGLEDVRLVTVTR